jgi:DNA polymerase-3 subunit gamma/tau
MLNLIDDETYFAVSDAVLTKNFKEVFEVTKQIYDNGWNFIDFMDGLIEHFRNIMTVVLSKNTNQVEAAEIYKERYLGYIDKFSEGDILRLFGFLNKAQQGLRYSQNQRLKIEISLSHLIGLEKTATISELIFNLNSNNSDAGIISEPENKNVYSSGTASKNYSAQIINNDKPSVAAASLNNKQVNLDEFEGNSFNFNNIVQKWAGFVESISREKSLTFGPFIKDIKLLSLDGNKINIYSNNVGSKDVIKFNRDYISQKTLEYFGRKMVFFFNDEPGDIVIDTPSLSQPANEPEDKKNSSGDLYIDNIINELGGEELQ